MPALSVRIVRMALVYLCAGAALGMFMQVGGSWSPGGAIWMLRPLHAELLLFGWMVQLVFGVAFWILPRAAESQSGALVVAACIALNLGIWLAGLGSVVEVHGVTVAGRTSELISVMLFASHAWPRIRGVVRR